MEVARKQIPKASPYWLAQYLVALLPLYYGNEDFILCDMPLAKGYSLIHAISSQNGGNTVWADQVNNTQADIMRRAREILKVHFPG